MGLKAKQVVDRSPYLRNKVRVQQVEKLIQKKLDQLPQTLSSESEEEPSQLDRLPSADYNRASASQLVMVKKRMEKVFQENVVAPGDSSFVYNKEVDFGEAEED